MARHHPRSDDFTGRRPAREVAKARVRRLTALIGATATAAAVGLGVLVASDTAAHSALRPTAPRRAGQPATGNADEQASTGARPPTTASHGRDHGAQHADHDHDHRPRPRSTTAPTQSTGRATTTSGQS